MADANGRVTFIIDPDINRQIGHLKADGKVGKMTDLINGALADKLASIGENPELSALTDLFNGLNPEGKSWLLQCARIAASSDSTREIVRRGKGAE